MTREELYAKLDKLFDSLDALKDKAEDSLDALKDRAGGHLGNAAFTADIAADEARRAACRGRGWLNARLVELCLDVDDVKQKLAEARAASDKLSAERYTKALEKYAEDMLEIAQEASDEAADAVAEAVQARRDYREKFGE